MESQEPLILAIDNGTQSVRALLFNRSGELVAKAQTPLTDYTSQRDGWQEHDAESFYQQMAATCQQLFADSEQTPEQIKAVVVTTQRATVINLDAKGQPLRPAIIWTDQRKAEIRSKRPWLWRLAFRLLMLKPTIDALECEAEINWIAQNQPEIWANTAHFLLLSGFLNYRLTGEVKDSIGSQVGYIPFDYKRQCWSGQRDWKWSCMPVARSQLPKLVAIGDTIGTITAAAARATGLLPGTPVIAGAADKACEVLGSGCIEETMGSISCGTTATINVCQNRYIEPRPFIPPYPAALPGHFNGEIQVFRGFWMVEWFVQQFGSPEQGRVANDNRSVEMLLDELVIATPPGAEGLMLQPYWNPGLGQPGPEARGSVIGFTDKHGRAHLYRALLEGLAYALREGKEQLERRSKIPIQRLRIAGGGSQSDAVMQILADVMQLPTERPSTYEASGLGAAIIAAVSLGYYPDYSAAVPAMTSVSARFEPNSVNSALYEQLYKQVYQRQYGRLQPLYAALISLLPR